MADDSGVSHETLDTIVHRITEAVQPRRIILFGSAVRGQMGPHSDLDLLVVMAEGTHRRRTAQAIYRCLGGLGVARDVVVVTEAFADRLLAPDGPLACRPDLERRALLLHKADRNSIRQDGARVAGQVRAKWPEGRPPPKILLTSIRDFLRKVD